MTTAHAGPGSTMPIALAGRKSTMPTAHEGTYPRGLQLIQVPRSTTQGPDPHAHPDPLGRGYISWGVMQGPNIVLRIRP